MWYTRNQLTYISMQDTLLYRPILRRAWQITSHYKKFWLLGLFAAIIGASGEYEIMSRLAYQNTSFDINTNIVGTVITSFQAGIEDSGGNLFDGLWAMTTTDPVNLIAALAIVIIALAIVGFLAWLAIVSQTGLIHSIDEADHNRALPINEAIDRAVRQFWPITAINIIMKLAIMLLLGMVSLAMIWLYPLGTAGLIAYYATFVIFVLAVFVVSLILKYQLFYLILDHQSLSESLHNAWALYRRNWLISIETSVLLFSIYVISTFCTLVISTFLVVIPLVLGQYYNLPAIIPVVGLLIAGVAIVVIAMLIGSIVMTFQWSVWSLLFRRINTSPETSRIIRTANALPAYLSGLVRR